MEFMKLINASTKMPYKLKSCEDNLTRKRQQELA